MFCNFSCIVEDPHAMVCKVSIRRKEVKSKAEMNEKYSLKDR